MVVANKTVVDREMARRGWELPDLVGAMRVSENTARAALSGTEPVSHTTQLKLYSAFGGHVPFTKLFTVTPGVAEEAATS
jgi:plasmid maintenance system antidote protein VapI